MIEDNKATDSNTVLLCLLITLNRYLSTPRQVFVQKHFEDNGKGLIN